MKQQPVLAEQVENEYKDSYRTQGRHLSPPPRRAMYMLALLCKPQVYRHKLFSRKWLRKMKSIRFLSEEHEFSKVDDVPNDAFTLFQ